MTFYGNQSLLPLTVRMNWKYDHNSYAHFSLGMGPDGHTCSLFPGHDLLNEKEKIVAPIKDSPKPPLERVTLTLPVLNSAKAVAFVSTGDGKKEMIKNVLKDKNEAFPASRVCPLKGDLFWIVDKPAAAHL